MPYFNIFKLEFEKSIVIFQASTHEHVQTQGFVDKKVMSPIWVFLGCSFEKLIIFKINTFK